jgi:hypothetical protein
MVVDGNTKQFIKFVNGTATIIVPAGQSSLELTIIDGNNVNIADLLTLSATIPGPNGTPHQSQQPRHHLHRPEPGAWRSTRPNISWRHRRERLYRG